MQRLSQDLGHSNFCCARYAEKPFTQIYRDLYGDAMLVLIRMGTNMVNLSLEELKTIKIILFSLVQELFR